MVNMSCLSKRSYSTDLQHQVQGFLPKDIIVDILARLPAKTLLRFESVCKSWQRLIRKDNHFIKLQFQRSHEDQCAIITRCLCFEETPSLAFDFQSYSLVRAPSFQFLNCDVKIKSSSHGLLCCQNSIDVDQYYVCNPITRKFTSLPKFSEFPSFKPWLVGLVFDSSMLNFKVVFLRNKSLDIGFCYIAALFDSEKDSWQNFELHAQADDKNAGYHESVFSNGSFYFSDDCRGMVSVLDLDLTTMSGVWRNIRKPSKVVAPSDQCLKLLNHGDSIFLVCISTPSYHMDVWCLCEDTDEQWRILAENVDCSVFGKLIYPMILCPLAINLDSVWVRWDPELIIVYNMRSKTWHNIETGIEAWFADTHSFKGSLFSLPQ